MQQAMYEGVYLMRPALSVWGQSISWANVWLDFAVLQLASGIFGYLVVHAFFV